MEIGAVASLVLARPDGVPAAPPGTTLVVAHRSVHVVVEGANLPRAALSPAAFLLGELANDSRQRDQLVGCLVERRAKIGVRHRGRPGRGETLDDEAHDEVSD